MLRYFITICLAGLWSASVITAQSDKLPGILLEEGFKNPPVTARPKALWPWVNGNFSLSQITYELEQAREKGMGGFDIWDVGTNMNPGNIVPDGPPFLGDESVRAIAHTINEADRLGLEIGLITSSSWNAGGAWVKPENAAMGLYRTDTILNGPIVFAGTLPLPEYPDVLKNNGYPPFYKEVAVIAYPIRSDSTIMGIGEVIDLTDLLQKGHTVVWNVPEGRWKITRYVCMPTGQQLAIPSPSSKGLMLDHFSANAQKANMKYVIDRLKAGVGKLDNRSLKYLYEDSYEVNSAVWTPDLPEQFKNRRGYSLIPYLPVLDGFTLSGSDTTDRFLFDFTKLLSDLIIENHYALGKEIAGAEGLGFYAEAGGPGKPIHNVPFEDLKALGALTVPRGEFWNMHPDLDKLQIVKGIASASHIYNQKFVEAESFTSVWLWQEGPGKLKPLADRAMCEGLNRFVYHTFPHTTTEAGKPGWIYNFGTIINTTNGWWSKSQCFHNYLARCSYLLQQGNFAGDVAFYYGDKAPNFVAPKHIFPGLGEGYDYDVVNTDILLHKMEVRDNRIWLPHGQHYEVLVLPHEDAMDPDVIEKLEKMVAEGATIIGPKPRRSYGIYRSDERDLLVQTIAGRLWGKCDSVNVKEHVYGKGRVIWGKSIREVLLQRSVVPDVQLIQKEISDDIDFIHRELSDADIYFVRNKNEKQLNGSLKFRITGRLPESWDPETGNITDINVYKIEKDGTASPTILEPNASIFVVFRKPIPAGHKEINPPDGNRTVPDPLALKGPWNVNFIQNESSPLGVVMDSLISWHVFDNDSVRHFSGLAVYQMNFTWPYEYNLKDCMHTLELNHVREIAEVFLNGKRLGYHWNSAHKFNVTGLLVPGMNNLVIDVVNSINNGLVGDAKKPESLRQTRSNITKLPNAWMHPFAEAPLIEAGLLGPVIVRCASLQTLQNTE